MLFCSSGYWSERAWILIAASVLDVLLTLRNMSWFESTKRTVIYMEKLKVTASKFADFGDLMMSNWVVRSMLLLLGLWEFPSQPNTRSGC